MEQTDQGLGFKTMVPAEHPTEHDLISGGRPATLTVIKNSPGFNPFDKAVTTNS
jgi:hypothetical protein